MTLKNRIAAFVAAAGAAGVLGAGSAQADTLRARFSSSMSSSVSVNIDSTTRNVGTVRFNWTRNDAFGAGVDGTVPETFAGYCVELAQGVSSNTNVTYDVLSPEAAGWTPERTLAVQVLWANYFGQVNSASTNAAFQLAMWELTHDTDGSLDTGSFQVASPAASKSLAQSWLTHANDPALRAPMALPTLVVLRNPTKQDQVTVIPAPGAAACIGAGLLMLGARRRR